MRLSWAPHPLGKFGHLGNKSLAFKNAFILLRLKTVCLYGQVELLVYTSTLHFRLSCDNVTMKHFFKRHICRKPRCLDSLFTFYHVSKGVKEQTFSQKLLWTEGSDPPPHWRYVQTLKEEKSWYLLRPPPPWFGQFPKFGSFFFRRLPLRSYFEL